MTIKINIEGALYKADANALAQVLAIHISQLGLNAVVAHDVELNSTSDVAAHVDAMGVTQEPIVIGYGEHKC